MKLGSRKSGVFLGTAVIATCLFHSGSWAQSSSAPVAPAPVQQGAAAAQPGDTAPAASSQPQNDAPVTPQQAKELFRSVNQILQFASDDTGLAIRHKVKRRLITREQVEKYVQDKFHDDKDVARMQREEIVLKKFGLLDRDFHLQPFLVSLLTEQIAAFYDNKTKTVNLLDWVAPDDQRPVLAHELTHALQDQYVNLDKWQPDTPDDVSKTVDEDNRKISIDERDTARDAVLEGQAMAVYVDYSLKPAGKSLLTVPDVSRELEASSSSPVMARAPLFLQESLLFPYRDGLSFEQTLLKDKGPHFAFAGVLDRPPSSSYEIMNPRAYERQEAVPLLKMPDIHPLLDAGYEAYDIGVMGEIDVQTLMQLLAGKEIAEALSPQWRGGIYYAVQSRDARTPEAKASTASIRLLYLSAWRSSEAAAEFARIYAQGLSRKYSGVVRDSAAESSPDEQVYRTGEGPVLIVRQGRQVFVSESFDLDMARRLQFLFFGAQTGEGTQVTARMGAGKPAVDAGHSATGFGALKADLRQVYLKP